jgi:cytochrome c oxidase cbb3-type subunit 3
VTPEHEEIVELERPDIAARDGIGEDDHPIPFWFNAGFGACIAFAVIYVLYHQASGWTQARRYESEMAEARAAAASAVAAQPAANPYRGDAAALAEGAQVFASICSVCHKPDGTGLVGPSLVDPFWKYGHGDTELFETVSKGRPGGMPPWGTQLGDQKIWKVLAYLETLPKQEQPGVGAPDYAPPAPAGAGS